MLVKSSGVWCSVGSQRVSFVLKNEERAWADV